VRPRLPHTGAVRPAIDVPEAVRRKALAVGAEGKRWLTELPQVVADLETDWDVRIGEAIVGGSGAYVAPAVRTDGTFPRVCTSGAETTEGSSRRLEHLVGSIP
jgi:hypothetical protein